MTSELLCPASRVATIRCEEPLTVGPGPYGGRADRAHASAPSALSHNRAAAPRGPRQSPLGDPEAIHDILTSSHTLAAATMMTLPSYSRSFVNLDAFNLPVVLDADHVPAMTISRHMRIHKIDDLYPERRT